MANGLSKETTCTNYYQVQTQLIVCKLSYGDFVVWMEGGIAVERIFVDNTKLYMMQDVEHFFIYGMLYWRSLENGIQENQWQMAVVSYHFLHHCLHQVQVAKIQLLMRNLKTTAKYGAIVANQVLADFVYM